jgi:hypothetical protein
MDEQNNILNNAKFLIQDVLAGDKSIDKREDFKSLSSQDVENTLNFILNNPALNEQEKRYIIENSWRINYKQKPPTIEEFLTPQWIGATALSIYPQVKETLCKFWAPTSPYRHLILACAIGWGKSLATAISILYPMIHMNFMKDPKKFYGLSQASAICSVLGSFTLAKAKQTLFKPFYEILQTSEKFRRVKSEDRVKLVQNEEDNSGSNKIVWTTASKMEGALCFGNDLNILIVSSIGSFLGLTILSGALSEISFFLGQGIAPEEIAQMYNDLKGRVFSRFSEMHFATTILDSSPNSFDSPIDKYVFSGEAEKDPKNLVVTSTHWNVHPSKYPIWSKTKETFPVFRGTAGRPPLVLVEEQRKNYVPIEIYDVPIDLKQMAINDLVKLVKDYCGWPGGSEEKLINDFNYIEKIFSKQLKNVYKYIICPATSNPERLIWDQIWRMFFIELEPNRFEFYRAPYAPRYIHIDLAETKDIAGIGCVHPELAEDGNMVVVTDFTIAIIPGKDRINLESIEDFVMDLRDLGHLNIELVTYDQYQSSEQRQNLEREEFETGGKRFSVDMSMIPYSVYISWIKNGRIKSGKNIFLKNNLKSLQEMWNENKTKKKIDHIKGKVTYEDGANWELSIMGMNSKDISDAHCGASYHCITHFKGIPRYQWYEDSGDTLDNNVLKKKAIENIHEKYSFKIREPEKKEENKNIKEEYLKSIGFNQ